MAVLDTNVVIRLLVGDDVAQARAAEQLASSEPCSVAMSVLMECEWVLRSSYALTAVDIDAALRAFLALENISAADPLLAQRVLDAYTKGLDFAAALHAAQCPEGERFLTFDKKLVERAAKAGLRGVARLAT